MSEATFLFLASNPSSPRRVTLDAEMRDIERRLDPAWCQVSPILRACWSASADGVRRALREARPAIVHVSGRGQRGADGSALCELLGAFKAHVRIAVFDGCKVEQPARLTEELDVVVCISASLADSGAKKLAARFYRSLLCGGDVEEAFQRGLKASPLTIDGPAARLLIRSGITASAVRVASNTDVQNSLPPVRAGHMAAHDWEQAEVGDIPCRLIVKLEGSPGDIQGERAARVEEVLRRLAGGRTQLTETVRDGSIRLTIVTSEAGRADLLAAIESRELTQLDRLAIATAETDLWPRWPALGDYESGTIYWPSMTNPADTEREGAHLLVAFECHRPRVPGLRLSLMDVDEVLIGRGTQRQWSRSNRQLLLTIPDRPMSRLHARLTSVNRGWRLDDVGSKNGTRVNGVATLGCMLDDGDVVEMGDTLFVYRARADVRVSGDRDLAEEVNVPDVFRTLSIDMERHAMSLALAEPTSAPVLLVGEPGTGKELVARELHALSGRRGPFVAAGCAGLDPDRLIALVAKAERGTLFLEAVHDLPAESQAALRPFLSQAGSGPPVPAEGAVAARIIASTDQDVPECIADGRFQPDLDALLAPNRVSIPPLRERPEDIGTIMSLLLAQLVDRPDFEVHPLAAHALLTYPYPMNVRELEETLRAAVELAPEGQLGIEHLPVEIQRCADFRSAGAGTTTADPSPPPC